MKESSHSYPRYMAMLSGVPVVLISILSLTYGNFFLAAFLLCVGLIYTIGSFMIGQAWPRSRKLWYTVLALPILSLIWSVYDYFTCTGKLCEFSGIFFGSVSVVFFATGWLLYCLARFGHKYKSLRILYLIFCIIAITLSVSAFFA